MSAYLASIAGLLVFALSGSDTVHSGKGKDLRLECERYAELPIMLGGLPLSVPAMENASVWMHGPNRSDHVSGDRGAFCVPDAMGKPPFNVSLVRLHGNEKSTNRSVRPDSRLSAALAYFGPVYSVQLMEHLAGWDSLPGGLVLARADAEQPLGTMTIGWPAFNGSPHVLALARVPDENSLRYAADCFRLAEVTTSICTITIADDKTGLDYRRPLVGIPDDVYTWRQNQPVPDAFVEIGMAARELAASLSTDPQTP